MFTLTLTNKTWFLTSLRAVAALCDSARVQVAIVPRRRLCIRYRDATHLAHYELQFHDSTVPKKKRAVCVAGVACADLVRALLDTKECPALLEAGDKTLRVAAVQSDLSVKPVAALSLLECASALDVTAPQLPIIAAVEVPGRWLRKLAAHQAIHQARLGTIDSTRDGLLFVAHNDYGTRLEVTFHRAKSDASFTTTYLVKALCDACTFLSEATVRLQIYEAGCLLIQDNVWVFLSRVNAIVADGLLVVQNES